jgi:hypothetical protein
MNKWLSVVIALSLGILLAGSYDISFTQPEQTHTIIASGWPGGTISPSGAISVDQGARQAFTISPNAGYLVLDVQVDGASIGAAASYEFNNVQSDHTIEASFQPEDSTCEVLLSESFEAGNVPPDGWTLLQNNPNETWQIHSKAPYISGTYFASVFYDQSLQPQDEVLLSPLLNMGKGTLRFWSASNPYWCRDDDNLCEDDGEWVECSCDLEVWIVVGDWDGGSDDDIYVGMADDDWQDAFQWALTSFDLNPLLPGKPVRLAFRYVAVNGAEIDVDHVQICYKETKRVMPWLQLLLADWF